MFSKATLAFLEEIAANNNRAWFEQNKPRYKRWCANRRSVSSTPWRPRCRTSRRIFAPTCARLAVR